LKNNSDKDQNLFKGQCIALNTSNTLIYGNEKKIVACLGLNDMVVVDTDDVLLICPKSKSQDVKKLVEKLKEEGLEKYL